MKHPFVNTLGAGPYNYVGYYDLSVFKQGRDHDEVLRNNPPPKLKDGLGTCAHCGHAIVNVMIVKNGANELYGVGSDCVNKVHAEGDVTGLTKMQRDIKNHKRQLRVKRERAQIEKLTPEYEAALKKLDALPHPFERLASQGKTLADYFRFCANGSNSTIVRYMKLAIKKATGE